MNASRIGSLVALSIAALLPAGLGCESTGQARPGKNPSDSWPTVSQEPGPAAPKPVASAPAPAKDCDWPKAGDPKLSWTHMAYPTGDAHTSALGISKGLPREVRAGQTYDYDISVTNLTRNELNHVVLVEELGGNFKLTGTAPAADNDGGALSWDLGDLSPCQTKIVKLTGTATAEGLVTSCCYATYSSVLCASVPVVAPKLVLAKSGPAEVLKCDPIVYTFEVANTGTGSIGNVKISDPLPAGLTAADGKAAIEFMVGTLAGGQSKKFTSTVQASKTGRFENKATATGDGGYNAASAAVATVVKQPVLTLVAECPGDTKVGRDLVFKFTVKNTGDGDADGTILTAPVPAGTTFVKADSNGTAAAGKATWNLGTLAPNASKTVSMTIKAGSIGSIAASASATAECAAAVADDCTTGVSGTPDIGTLVTDEDGVVPVGANHTYTCEVKNQGQIDLTKVTMRITLPEALDYVSSSALTPPKVTGRVVEFALPGALKPGETKAFTMTVKSRSAGEFLIIGETTAAELRNPIRDDELTNFIEP